MVYDGTNIFFFELRGTPCNDCLFINYTGWLFRSGPTSQSGLANIYQTTSSNLNPLLSYSLDDDGTYLYWLEGGAVLRLANTASALPQSPMSVVGLEVTQGSQTTTNSVPLIQNKNTWVRVYVKSDDSTRDVPGVTAELEQSDRGNWIWPINGPAITVKRNPSRQQLDDSFLFALPASWVSGSSLELTALLNPYRDPQQSDGYIHDELTAGPFHLNASPRLEIRLFEYSYNMGGQTWGPAYSEKFGDIAWIQAAYPVDSLNDGNLAASGVGLHWDWTSIFDQNLAAKVRYPVPCPSSGCDDLRASAYVASQIAGMRSTYEADGYGDTDTTSYYGLITGGSEQVGSPPATVSYFPRGQDSAKNAAGPAGQAYLGWYAAHEVGHSVGLGHPLTAADGSTGGDCGIQGSDSLPTYPHGHIGSNDDTSNTEGFLGALSYYPYDNSALAIGSQTMDFMAYCRPQWESDQNFPRIYKNLTGNTPTHAPAQVRAGGDWLVVYGSINTSTNTATMDYLRRVVGSVTVPPITPGPYAIRLLDASNAKLQDYAFTPDSADDSPSLSFGQVVAFVAGTRQVQIVRLSDGSVLASASTGANPPSVGSVALSGAPYPVSGIVTLGWIASDGDKLPLTFDVWYSHDNGATFDPLQTNLTATSTKIDTSGLGGGKGVFRVIASDGVQTASADSPAYTMADNPPMAHISQPAGNASIHYGQTVNFSGYAVDPQDGFVASSGLAWEMAGATLGKGPALTDSTLPPGTDVVELLATDSAGLTGKMYVTVFVDDNIDPAGPTLEVTPGTVAWDINAGVTAKQQRTFTVDNSGGGTLTWSVTSNTTWLSVSASSGNQGDTVVATGDPTGMVPGQTLTGNLTFSSSSGTSPQQVVVPVSLTEGNPYAAPYSGTQPTLMYLPLVKR